MQDYKTLLPQVVLRFLLIVSFVESSGHEELGKVVDDLHPAEDGEAGEEPHGALRDVVCSVEYILDWPIWSH